MHADDEGGRRRRSTGDEQVGSGAPGGLLGDGALDVHKLGLTESALDGLRDLRDLLASRDVTAFTHPLAQRAKTHGTHDTHDTHLVVSMVSSSSSSSSSESSRLATGSSA